MYFSTEVFALQQGESALLYAPLLGIVARLNLAGVHLLQKLERTPEMGLRPPEAEFLSRLAELGLTRRAAGITLSRPDETSFVPRCVSLYLTDACNLRCVYCYARAGEALVPTVMPFEAGAAGIRFVADMVKRQGQDGFAVSFHGAGEPTVAWDLLVRLADYARQIAKQEDVRVSLTTCTNGVMSAERAVWLARHTDGATVSLDGDAQIQNALRPCRNGAGSFDQVARTLTVFRDEGFYHSIRATITDANVHKMTEMVELMNDRFGASHLQFDPVLVTGRCLETGCGAVDSDTFALEFMRAYDRAQEHGIELGFSILSVDSLRTYYCCAVSDGFTVTHDGLLTSCFDVYRPDHPFSEHFIYGAYDSQKDQIQIDQQKLVRLRCRNACRLSTCAHCFCKYMCCGDCTTNAMRQGLAFMEGGGRCRMTQAIGAHMLARKAVFCGHPVLHSVVPGGSNDFSLMNAVWADGHANETPMLLGGSCFPVHESYYMRPLPTDEGVRQLIGTGNTAYRRRDYAKALHQYEEARQLDPGSAEAHCNLALVLHKLGRLEEALIEAERAVALASQAASSHMTYGKVLAACGRTHDALAAFECVLALEPDRTDARYNRAWVLAELGRVDEAETILVELTQMIGEASDAAVLLRSLQVSRGAAEDFSHRLLSGNHAWMPTLNARLLAGVGVPTTPSDKAKLATVLDDCSREQFGRARQTLDDLIRTYPSSGPLRGLSGMLWQTQGNPELASLEMQLAGDVFQT